MLRYAVDPSGIGRFEHGLGFRVRKQRRTRIVHPQIEPQRVGQHHILAPPLARSGTGP